MKNKFKIIIIIIALVILLIITTILILTKVDFNNENTAKTNKLTLSEDINKTDIDDSNRLLTNDIISLIPLKVDEKNKIEGTELLPVNDYKIVIPDELVKIGYDIFVEEDVMTITAKDNSYKCILIQLSDNYIIPKEEEIERLRDTNEYKEWDEEDYDYDDDESFNLHLEKYDKISTSYYKKLGYTAKNSPDYVLTNKEMNSIIGKYILDGNSNSSGSTGLFPGYKYYEYYSWGQTKTYTIPKYYNDNLFGEMTSDFSVYLCVFEYYNSSEVNFNVDLLHF